MIGAGTMGHGIAQVAAMAGYETRLTDASADSLAAAWSRIQSNLAGAVSRGKLTRAQADAAIANIVPVAELSTAARDADLVIEAVVEEMAVKQSLFRQLDAVVPDETILATNTSSLSVARIAEGTTRPNRVVGMHFFNPVHIMKLVEIVTHAGCDESVVALARAAAERMGKTTILVRDTPGFASSRLGVALGLEAMRMLEDGVASAADIDTAMELGYGHPMGPLRLTDLVGLDVRLKIAEYLHRELADEKFAPPRVLREKVERGELGKKTGKGFYEW
ncbi:MAG TPA: 3-hydroxyacyl-CoA dehydrogenase family protein [Vicinamibacterales bacterium]|nr:3-hydroxyacyl-CoA dehydrogenase family protein [Vicinamibacterales bacterium]